MRLSTLSGAFTVLLIAGLVSLSFLPLLVAPPPTETTAEPAGQGQPLSGDFTLAISWQPAFCELNQRRPECASQTPDRFDSTSFSLHGLWPDPSGNIYCGRSESVRRIDEAGDWHRLPDIELPPDIRAELDVVMPGTQSHLDRHEWTKHGVCTNGDAEAYFAASVALMDALNRSPLRTLFRAYLGAPLGGGEIRDAFESTFGPGAGNRVQVECVSDGDRRLIDELRISLAGTIGDPPDLAALILAAPERSPGCPEGVVDPAGWQ